jgi:hypothetical protein
VTGRDPPWFGTMDIENASLAYVPKHDHNGGLPGSMRAQLRLTFLAALALLTAALRTCEAQACQPGFAGSDCSLCQAGFYGPSCLPCPSSGGLVCNGQGVCSDGRSGTGLCSCVPPYFGVTCQLAEPTGLSPTHGPAAGGTRITITGPGFGVTPGSVTVGGVSSAIVAWSAVQIACVTPPGSGHDPVQVLIPGGDVLTGLVFNYDSPPVPAPAVPAMPAGAEVGLGLFLGLAGIAAILFRSPARSRRANS